MDDSDEVIEDALNEAEDETIAATLEQLRDAFKGVAEAFQEWLEPVVQVLSDGLDHISEWAKRVVQALNAATRNFVEVAIQLDLLEDGSQVSPAQRRAWRRQMVVVAVRPIDAVAAGRQPAMLFRARRVGGRR